MGETKASQKQVKAELDAKLKLAAPSREILEELAIGAASNPSPDNTFQYAFCLSKSTEKTELRYAVTILDGLVKEGYEHQMDCMYGAACALYLLGEYDQARSRCEAMLRARPESRLAAELHLAATESQEQLEDQQVKKAAAIGAVAVAAVGVLGVIASAMLTKHR
ncbi:Fis1 C-terminal tetratricopeptide repeat [Fragilaria crotonensis]|nr:Fis1 C-terminal tetratricopeptide repeat [Fragilaria crotonensis]